MLEKIDTGIWLVNGECVNFYGFPYPTRMVVVRLSDGGIWVWSPIKLTDTLVREINALGSVKHLIGPNKIHHLFLSDWAKVWPKAKIWGPQSLIDKRTDLHFHDNLQASPPSDWASDLDQAWFKGSLFMDEVVFFHRASKTAILADISENFSVDFLKKHWGPWLTPIAKIWKITPPYGYAPLEWRLSFLKRRALRQARDKVLSWGAERVIMAHGDWQNEKGSDYLKRAFKWM